MSQQKYHLFIFIYLLFSISNVFAADRLTVVVDGIEGEVLKNVLSFLSIEQQKEFASLSDERIARLIKKGKKEIKQALQPFGYYKHEVTSEHRKTESGLLAYFKINQGVPVKISNVDLKITGEATDDSKFYKLQRDFPLVAGARLNHALYERAKNSLEHLASERGFFDSRFITREIRLDLDNDKAEVILHLDSGRRYYFGEVIFKQNIFAEEFLKRYIPFRIGEPYTLSAFLELDSLLNGSDYFEKVDVKLRHDLAEGLVIPVEVTLETRKRTKYGLGIGFGTDTGGRLRAGVERRRINKWGHKANIVAQVSRIRDSITVRYIIPQEKPQTDQLVIATGWESEDVNDIASTKTTLSLSHTHLSHNWQKTYFLNYELEDYEIGADEDDSTLVMPGVNWTRIRTNNRIYTTFGNRFVIEVKGGSETLGSTSSFLQALFGVKFIRKLFDKGRIIARGDLGYTDVMDLNDLPPSVRFFAGGDQSVRGYGYNTLGPVNDQGIVVGGNHLLVGSLELEFSHTGSWSSAVFYDVGNAMDDFGDDLKRGTGFGVRYRSVIGMFRLDVATGLDKPGNPWRLHLSIGADL